MSSRTPFFKGFGPLLFGRRPRFQIEKVRRLDSMEDLYEIFGDLLPERMLYPAKKGIVLMAGGIAPISGGIEKPIDGPSKGIALIDFNLGIGGVGGFHGGGSSGGYVYIGTSKLFIGFGLGYSK